MSLKSLAPRMFAPGTQVEKLWHDAPIYSGTIIKCWPGTEHNMAECHVRRDDIPGAVTWTSTANMRVVVEVAA